METLETLDSIACVFSTLGVSGLEVPAPDDARERIVAMEYFLDTDPGTGQGTPVPIVGSGTGSVAATIRPQVDGLTPGRHALFVRSQNERGDWSVPSAHYFTLLPYAFQSEPEVTEIEYFLGADPGAGNGADVNGVEPNATVTRAFSTLALGRGATAVQVRAKDEYGNWSLPHYHSLYVAPFGIADEAQIAAAEYFIGADPGVGNGIPIEFESPSGDGAAFEVSIPDDTPGSEIVSFRVQDSVGNWSVPSRVRYFQVPALPVTAIEWTLREGETVVESGNRAVNPAAVNFVSSIETTLAGEESLVGRELTLEANLVLVDRIPTVPHSIDFVIDAIADPLIFLNQGQLLAIVEGEGFSLSAQVRGNPPISYQWLKNGVEIPGATQASFSVAESALADAGIYSVRVIDLYSDLTAEVASVDISEAPSLGEPHPADSNADFVMSVGEVTAYGAAWRRGSVWPVAPNPIPIGYVTRAGALWQGGETYILDSNVAEPPLWWVNTEGGLQRQSLPGAAGVVNRSVDGDLVEIQFHPKPGVRSFAFEERLPLGVSAKNIEHGGVFLEEGSRLRWGPFNDGQERVLRYRLVGTEDASTLVFSGVASFDGINHPIVGTGPQDLDAEQRFSPTLALDFEGGGLVLTGTPGQRYRVESASNPVDGPWGTETTLELEMDSAVWIDPGFGEAEHRFYRAVLVPGTGPREFETLNK